MNKVLIIVIVLVIVIGGVWLLGSSPSNTESVQEYDKIAADIEKGASLLDVRTAAEFTNGHIVDAQNLSLQDIQNGSLPEISKDSKLYVYCQSGNRSAQATALLKEAGYTNIEDLGGINRVVSMGATVTK